MLYLDKTIDLTDHKMIEIKNDEVITLTQDEIKSLNFELVTPDELNGKFCFVETCFSDNLFISECTTNACKVKETTFRIIVHKDRSLEKDSVIEKGTVIAYLCYIPKNIYEENCSGEEE